MQGPKYQLQNLQELCRANYSDDQEPEVIQSQVQIGRRDRFGNLIDKQLKFHISFRDNVKPQSQIYDIYVVENWKNYNIIDEKEEPEVCCKQFCSIL